MLKKLKTEDTLFNSQIYQQLNMQDEAASMARTASVYTGPKEGVQLFKNHKVIPFQNKANSGQRKVILLTIKKLFEKLSEQETKAKQVHKIDWPEDCERRLSVPEK